MLQLLECCDENLRKDITRNAGGSLANHTVDQVLEAVKRLAVREENAMIARVQLSDMRQDRDEAIRTFGARLRGQASVCKFTVACPSCNNDVPYTHHILRDVLIKGLADHEIQLDLLGDTNQDMSLEEVFQFVEAKEAGKRSAWHLLHTQGVEAARSQYCKTKQAEVRHNAAQQTHRRTNMSPAHIAASAGTERMPLPKSEKPSVQLMTSLVATVVNPTIVQSFAAAKTNNPLPGCTPPAKRRAPYSTHCAL